LTSQIGWEEFCCDDPNKQESCSRTAFANQIENQDSIWILKFKLLLH
jgi:hypothetical protein